MEKDGHPVPDAKVAEAQTKLFNEMLEHHKKMFDDNGIHAKHIHKFVEKIVQLAPIEDRSHLTRQIITDAIIYGTGCYYEAIGMLEDIKQNLIMNVREDYDVDEENLN